MATWGAVKTATVVQLGADGVSAVVADTEDGDQQTMQCAGSYVFRAAGDVVLCAKKPNGVWLILCKERGQVYDPPEPLTEARVIELITARLPQVVEGREITMGVGAPSGSGWRQSTGLYVQENGQGGRRIYVDTASPDPPSTPPPPPPSETPAPVTVQPVSQGGWRGSETNPLPIVGSYNSPRGNWSGGWWYGDRIADACQGRTVKSMTITVSRLNDGHGQFTGVPVTLGTHDQSGRPSIGSTWATGARLSLGGATAIAIPAAQRAQLASGSRRGIGAVGSGASQYIKFGRGGAVRIEFS